MKTTMMFRPIANPRRTTLSQLKDAEEPQTPPAGDEAAEMTDAEEVTEARQLPQQTANPRRTVLMKLPGAE
jgi:hypothetical protein